MANHDLIDLINSASDEIGKEYERIRKKAKADPGTAGDQGEENWAHILRQWLPSSFHVVTKGRIINSRGETSPQVDVVVLKPEYPTGLLNKKLYLAEAVLAVFECKLTLNATDLKKFFRNSVKVHSLNSFNSKQTIYDEVQSPIFYGLLAHSHAWKKDKEVLQKIEVRIFENDATIITHPIEMPDLICIADTGCWIANKNPLPQISVDRILRQDYQNIIMTLYVCEQAQYPGCGKQVKPIGSAIKGVISKISKEHPGLKSIAKYFRQTLPNTGRGYYREWLPTEVFSKKRLQELEEISKDRTYNFPANWWHLNVNTTF